jgi:ketosteroid isomerase-like protein/pimeloyl-ACP methyl ester carboxylesterase
MPIVKHLMEITAFSSLKGLKLCAVLLAILDVSGAGLAQAQTKYSPIPEYKKVGHGTQTLLLIPCMSCRWNEWEEFMERNQTKYTMYAVTIPGYGGAPAPDLPRDTDRPLWHDNAVNALAQFLDEQKLREVTVVGHSWGTIIGVQLAAHRPDVIKRLIAVDGSIENTSWKLGDKSVRLAQARQIVEANGQKFADAEEWRNFNSAGLPAGETVPRSAALQALKLHGSFMATAKETLLQYWRENVLIDLTSAARRLTIPILDIKCLNGTAQEQQRKTHLDTLRQAGLSATVKTIFFYDTGHYVMFQRPQELDCVIGEYLNGKAVADFKPNTTGAEDGGDDIALVKKVLAGIIAADNASDVERIVAFYEDDALLLPPAGHAVAGKAAIKERYRQGFEKARLELVFHSEETQVAGAWAFDRGLTSGRNVWRDGREPTKFEHKYLMILKRQSDGAWKIARLIWSDNLTE